MAYVMHEGSTSGQPHIRYKYKAVILSSCDKEGEERHEDLKSGRRGYQLHV